MLATSSPANDFTSAQKNGNQSSGNTTNEIRRKYSITTKSQNSNPDFKFPTKTRNSFSTEQSTFPTIATISTSETVTTRRVATTIFRFQPSRIDAVESCAIIATKESDQTTN